MKEKLELPKDPFVKRLCVESGFAIGEIVGATSDEICDIFGVSEPPTPWRIQVMKNLISKPTKKAFGELLADNDTVYEKGLQSGLVDRFKRLARLEKELEEYSDDESFFSSWIEAIESSLGFSGDTSELPIEDAESLLNGVSKGIQSFDADNALAYTDARLVYTMLLRNADEIEKMDTVEQMYKSIKNRLGSKLPHELDSFRKICTRIGLVGRKTAKGNMSMDRR